MLYAIITLGAPMLYMWMLWKEAKEDADAEGIDISLADFR